jgi:hypothetical protein
MFPISSKYMLPNHTKSLISELMAYLIERENIREKPSPLPFITLDTIRHVLNNNPTRNKKLLVSSQV